MNTNLLSNEQKLSLVGTALTSKTFDDAIYTTLFSELDKNDWKLLKSAVNTVKSTSASVVQEFSWGEEEITERNVDHLLYCFQMRSFLNIPLSIHSHFEQQQGNKSFSDYKNLTLDDLIYTAPEKLLKEEYSLTNQVYSFWNEDGFQSLYANEIQRRLPGLLVLKEGYRHLPKVLKIDHEIHLLNESEKNIRLRRFFQGESDITGQEANLIGQLRTIIENLKKEKENLLSKYEIAVVYEVEKIKEYKRQLNETGFIMTESRKKLYQEIYNSILHGHSILLTGGTGSGKTAFAIFASKEIQKELRNLEGISTVSLFAELDSVDNLEAHIDSLVGLVDSGNEEILGLLYGSKAYTMTQILSILGFDRGLENLGKIMKHWREGSMPILTEDEINTSQYNLLLKLFGLFTYKISGTKLKEELDNAGNLKDKLDEYIANYEKNDPSALQIASGVATLSIGELLAKTGIKPDPTGKSPQSYTELGKYLSAIRDGKPFIFDELDLTGNEILLGLKRVMDLKVGEKFIPQQGSGEKHVRVKLNTVIGTANLRSSKHPDRENLDAAITRMLRGIHVPYFDKKELLRVIKTHLSNDFACIPDVDIRDFKGEQSFVAKLSTAAYQTQLANYGELSLDGNSDPISLQKAILDTGNFSKLFSHYGEDDGPLVSYVRKGLRAFCSNSQFSEQDRLNLIRIFTSKDLFTFSDLEKLIKLNPMISEDQIRESFMNLQVFDSEEPNFYAEGVSQEVLLNAVNKYCSHNLVDKNGKILSDEKMTAISKQQLRNYLYKFEKDQMDDPHGVQSSGFIDPYQLVVEGDSFGELNINQRNSADPKNQFLYLVNPLFAEISNIQEDERSEYDKEIFTVLSSIFESLMFHGIYSVSPTDTGKLLFALKRTKREEYIDPLKNIFVFNEGNSHYLVLQEKYEKEQKALVDTYSILEGFVNQNKFVEGIDLLKSKMKILSDIQELDKKLTETMNAYQTYLIKECENAFTEKNPLHIRKQLALLSLVDLPDTQKKIKDIESRLSSLIEEKIGTYEAQCNSAINGNNFQEAQVNIQAIKDLDNIDSRISVLTQKVFDAERGIVEYMKEEYLTLMQDNAFDDAEKKLTHIESLSSLTTSDQKFVDMQRSEFSSKKRKVFSACMSKAEQMSNFSEALNRCLKILSMYPQDNILLEKRKALDFGTRQALLLSKIDDRDLSVAVDLLSEMKNIYTAGAFGVVVSQIEANFEEVRDGYCLTKFEELRKMMQGHKFEEARKIENEILKVHPGFKDLQRGQPSPVREYLQKKLDGRDGFDVINDILTCKKVGVGAITGCWAIGSEYVKLNINVDDVDEFFSVDKDIDNEVTGLEFQSQPSFVSADELRKGYAYKKVLVGKDSSGFLYLETVAVEGIRTIGNSKNKGTSGGLFGKIKSIFFVEDKDE